tara:strand:+ start:2571 stop:2768 length:198 start_codon:yes stop_codon:yes gene_type:complete
VKYHIVVHEITCKYLQIEAADECEAQALAKEDKGIWLRLPLLLERKIVRTHSEDVAHETDAENRA